MRNLPTGQYRPGQSLFHRMSASVKIINLLLFTALIVMTSTVYGYVGILLFMAALIGFSRIPLKVVLGSVLRLWQFLIIIFFMNAFFFQGEQVLFSWWIFHLSVEGMAQGAQVVIRVGMVVLLTNLLTCTSLPTDITSGLEQLMRPLSLFHIPVEEVAMIISVALQFIPILMEETEHIKKAQIARGARFESKKILEKASSFLPLVIPIFVAAFRRADELSMAMEARGYRNARQRTKKEYPHWKRVDYYSFVCCILFCICGFYKF